MIDTLQTWLLADPRLKLCLSGMALGFALGWILQRTNFCVMGGLSDAAVFGDTRRLRTWLLAIAVAILGAHALEGWQIIDLNQSRYLGNTINWLGQSLGGFVFGIGMVLAGGCASRNVVRAGAGDLRALLVILVLAIFAQATISGVFAPLRVSTGTTTALAVETMRLPGQRLSDMVTPLSAARAITLRWTIACLAALALLVFAFRSETLRRSPRDIAAGLAVGVIIVCAWALTGLAYDELADRTSAPQAISFVAPTGWALDWIARATAIGVPRFGASIVIGTLIGSFISAWVSQSWHVQTFRDVADTLRHLVGAALMGVGGVFALGCTIGQGISGLSTLSIGSLISVAGIVAGALVTLKRFERAS